MIKNRTNTIVSLIRSLKQETLHHYLITFITTKRGKLFVICILKQLYTISDISKLISLATEKISIESAYDKFCDELENAISITFAGSKYVHDNNLSLDNYVLRNVVFSFANKLYVEKTYLRKK